MERRGRRSDRKASLEQLREVGQEMRMGDLNSVLIWGLPENMIGFVFER